MLVDSTSPCYPLNLLHKPGGSASPGCFASARSAWFDIPIHATVNHLWSFIEGPCEMMITNMCV
jgi:hypothetical protein